jgi:hypothetical protein
MSDEDDFLARWSRRKRAARSGEVEPEAEAEAKAAERRAPEPEPAASEPAEPLPSLDDLTAESDLAAFLREGVPAALRNAAMRKMWSLDPVVRDYVGPSEYAWDFNRPGSMAGFGALGTRPSIAGLLSTARRVLPDASSRPAQEPEAPPRQAADDAPEQDAGAPPDPGRPAEPEAGAAPAETERQAAPEASPRTPPRPRHGRALPR